MWLNVNSMGSMYTNPKLMKFEIGISYKNCTRNMRMIFKIIFFTYIKAPKYCNIKRPSGLIGNTILEYWNKKKITKIK